MERGRKKLSLGGTNWPPGLLLPHGGLLPWQGLGASPELFQSPGQWAKALGQYRFAESQTGRKGWAAKMALQRKGEGAGLEWEQVGGGVVSGLRQPLRIPKAMGRACGPDLAIGV